MLCGIGYDIIGDIHGHASELQALLLDLGYSRHGRGFRHPNRRAIFVGDFIDRGPAIWEVLQIVRSMVEANDALAVMGNHEYNAIAFHTPIPNQPNSWFRAHSDKNLKQHQATLNQLSPVQLGSMIEWFKTLPVVLEVDGLRVVHAAWQASDIAVVRSWLESTGMWTVDFLLRAEVDPTLQRAIENVLKGPEIRLPAGKFILDKAGDRRDTIRIRWYETGTGRTYLQHHLGSDEVPDAFISSHELTTLEPYANDAVPVFIGHYWLSGTPVPLAANVACTDYSVAKGGKLVAYRWDGEAKLSACKFFWSQS